MKNSPKNHFQKKYLFFKKAKQNYICLYENWTVKPQIRFKIQYLSYKISSNRIYTHVQWWSVFDSIKEKKS